MMKDSRSRRALRLIVMQRTGFSVLVKPGRQAGRSYSGSAASRGEELDMPYIVCSVYDRMRRQDAPNITFSTEWQNENCVYAMVD